MVVGPEGDGVAIFDETARYEIWGGEAGRTHHCARLCYTIVMNNDIISALVVLAVAIVAFFVRDKYSFVAKILSVLAFVFIVLRYIVIMLGCLFSCRNAEIPTALIIVVGLAASATFLVAWSFIHSRLRSGYFYIALVLFILFSVGNIFFAMIDTGSLRFNDNNGNYVYAPIKYTYDGGSIEQFAVFDKNLRTWSEYGWGERNSEKEVIYNFIEVERTSEFYTLNDMTRKTMLRIPISGGMSSISVGGTIDWKPYKLLTKIED